MSEFSTRIQLRKRRLPALVCGIAIAGALSLSSCSSEPEYTEETEVVGYTQGVITEVEEVKAELFKITDETAVPTVEDSRIIASYMDGGIDTFTLDEVQLVDANEDGSTSRRSGIRGAVMGGLLGYMMGRSMSSPRNPSAYKSQNAYNKSSSTANTLKSSAKTRTVRKPKAGKSGYSGGKSTRSYGG